MADWETSYTGAFPDPANNETDEDKLHNKEWVPCRICWDRFGRLRLTDRYCHDCHRGFCEGEHGSFDQNKRVHVCIRHDGRLYS
jgi:hypothetical protein